MTTQNTAPRWAIIAAFAAIYFIWGSTYLGIKVAIETMPPFLMSSGRYLIAGAILYSIGCLSGTPRPGVAHWRHSLIVGVLLIVGGNAVVSLAERWVDSSMAALVIACNPFFMTLFGWWAGVERRPGSRAWLSLFGGLCGVILLIVSDQGIAAGGSLAGVFLLLLAVISWTSGSIYSKLNPQTIHPILQSGMQMLCGGVMSLLLGGVLGEWRGFDVGEISSHSWYAFVYLTVIGSLVGFTSYVYLLKHCSPSAVSSHAYVNPVVAVFLGWIILDESITTGGIVGSCLILVSVYVLLSRNREKKRTTES